MASKLIGRCTCPECGFASAHVKIKTDKEGANPYRHCPDCGAQYFAKNMHQGDNLRRMMRPIDAPAAPAASSSSSTPPAAQETPPPPPPPKVIKTDIFGFPIKG